MKENKNIETEEIAKSYLDKIRILVKEGSRATLWLKKGTWENIYDEKYKRIFSIVSLPSEKTLITDTVREKILQDLNVQEYIPNIYEGPIGWGYYEYWHEYAATNISKVFIHWFSWTGEAWGGSHLVVSVNIEEKEFLSVGNIPWEIYQAKYKKIENAVVEGKPYTLLLKEKRYRSWSWTEEIPLEILDNVFQRIPRWLPDIKPLPSETVQEEKVYEEFERRVRISVRSSTRIIEEKQIKAEGGNVWSWRYDKTKFPNVYFHTVVWKYKFEKETNLIYVWEFLTINISEEQFR